MLQDYFKRNRIPLSKEDNELSKLIDYYSKITKRIRIPILLISFALYLILGYFSIINEKNSNLILGCIIGIYWPGSQLLIIVLTTYSFRKIENGKLAQTIAARNKVFNASIIFKRIPTLEEATNTSCLRGIPHLGLNFSAFIGGCINTFAVFLNPPNMNIGYLLIITIIPYIWFFAEGFRWLEKLTTKKPNSEQIRQEIEKLKEVKHS